MWTRLMRELLPRLLLALLLASTAASSCSRNPEGHAPRRVAGDVSTGVQIGEHMPQLAQQLGRWSIVRTLKHVEGNHLLAMHVALTGRPYQGTRRMTLTRPAIDRADVRLWQTRSVLSLI